MIIAAVAFLVGSVLGWGLRVWILIPASALALIGSLAPELFESSGLAALILRGTLSGVALHSGYAFGSIYMIMSSKPSHDRTGVIVPFISRSIP